MAGPTAVWHKKMAFQKIYGLAEWGGSVWRGGRFYVRDDRGWRVYLASKWTTTEELLEGNGLRRLKVLLVGRLMS